MINISKIEQYGEDLLFLSKFKEKYKISGCYCGGSFYRTVKFKMIKSNIIFDWNQITMDIQIYKEERALLLEAYTGWMWMGEWEEFKKPIIFMEICNKSFNFKHKDILSVEKIYEITEEFENFNLKIYFETILHNNPIDADFLENNWPWINYIGGLYDVVDPDMWIEENNNTEIKILEEASITVIERKEVNTLAIETAETAIEMAKNNLNWKIFKKNDMGNNTHI